MNDRLPPHPALDVAWLPSACDVAVLHELLAVALDDPQTTRGAGLRARTVAANLTGAALMQGHLDLAACVEPGGLLLVSGFTCDEAGTVLSALSQVGELGRTYGEDGWCAAALRVLPQPEADND